MEDDAQMKECTIYHTGVYVREKGVIKNNKVYFTWEDKLYLPEEIFLAKEECEGGLIQFEVEEKWGFANIHTGEIIIEPLWEYAGPFYRGYAHVAAKVEAEINEGCNSEMGGRHGYIDISGNIVIPLEYDYVMDIPYHQYFEARKNGQWGLIDRKNKVLIPFNWHILETSYRDELIFCARKEACEAYVGTEDKFLASIMDIEPEPTRDYIFKWGVYGKEFNLIIEPELDEKPYNPVIKPNPRSKRCRQYDQYYVLKKHKQYGILSRDGRIIADMKLLKKQAKAMLNSISGRIDKDLYI